MDQSSGGSAAGIASTVLPIAGAAAAPFTGGASLLGAGLASAALKAGQQAQASNTPAAPPQGQPQQPQGMQAPPPMQFAPPKQFAPPPPPAPMG